MKGVKLTNEKSFVASRAQEEKRNQAEFEKHASGVHNQKIERKKRLIELGGKFHNMLQDKTLLVNKGIISKNFEGKTLAELVDIATQINNDETEPECSGAVALNIILMEGLMIMRNRFNDIEYALFEERTKSASKKEEIVSSMSVSGSDDPSNGTG